MSQYERGRNPFGLRGRGGRVTGKGERRIPNSGASIAPPEYIENHDAEDRVRRLSELQIRYRAPVISEETMDELRHETWTILDLQKREAEMEVGRLEKMLEMEKGRIACSATRDDWASHDIPIVNQAFETAQAVASLLQDIAWPRTSGFLHSTRPRYRFNIVPESTRRVPWSGWTEPRDSNPTISTWSGWTDDPNEDTPHSPTSSHGSN